MLTFTRNSMLGYILLFGITLICLTYIPVQDAGAHDEQHSYTWDSSSISDITLCRGDAVKDIALPRLTSTDNDDQIRYKIDGLPAGLHVSYFSGYLVGTSTELVSNKALTYIGYVVGGDHHGKMKTLTFNLTVEQLPYAWSDYPCISASTRPPTENLANVKQNASVNQPLPKLIVRDGGQIRYTATGLPKGLSVTHYSGTLYGTPDVGPTEVGKIHNFTYTAKVRTFDSDSNLTIKYFPRTFTIRVNKSSHPPQQTEDVQISQPPEEVTADGVDPQANLQIDTQPTESAEQIVQVVTPQQTPQRSPAQSLQAPEPQVSQDEERTEAVVSIEEGFPTEAVKATDEDVPTDIEPVPVTPTEPTVLIDADQRPPMYWIDKDAGTLHRLVGDVVEDIYPSVSHATNLVVDTAGNKLYWTEQTTGERSGKIQSAGLDLTNIQTIHEQPNAPRWLAFDAVNNTLYFTNGLRRIQRVNVDGNPGFRWDLIISDEKPKHLTVDGARGKIYWAEKLYGTLGEIKSANLDGSGIRTLKKWIAMPTSLCVNTTANHLYFTNFEAILRVNVNDPLSYISATHVISGLDSPTSVAVDSVDNKLYWAEGDKIQRANLDGNPNVEDVATTLGVPVGITVAPVVIPIEEVPAAPVQVASDKTTLLANYPNPFNPETWIPYQLQDSGEVQITIYSQNGVLVRELSLGHQVAGRYTSRSRAAHWDGRNWQGERVASGIYFYQLTTDETSPMRKMVILK